MSVAIPHLLIVDDDKEICALLARFLSEYGYRVSVAPDGEAMMQTLANARIDLVVLDIMLPGKNGLVLCQELRSRGRLPIIMLTAIGDETDRVVGLEMGADDYVAKALRPARAARPHPGGAAPRRRATARRGARRRPGLRIPRLAARCRAPPAVFPSGCPRQSEGGRVRHPARPRRAAAARATRDQLLDIARGRTTSPFDRSIDVHISRLRRRIEEDPKEPAIIKTVRSGGYLFAAPVIQTGAAE